MQIIPMIAKRYTKHGSDLGKHRSIIESVFAWLFQNRRSRVRYEKHDNIHQALLYIRALMICWKLLGDFVMAP